MKFNRLTASPLKCFKVPKLDGGIDLNAVKDNCLRESLNLWYEGESLRTRPGIITKSENAVVIEKQSYYEDYDFRLHEQTVNYLDTEYHIATVGVCTDDYTYSLYIYFVASEINILKVGTLNFLRISSDIFKVPENITFYVGKPQQGGGVFALITLKNLENSNEKNYNVYEINSEFTDWERVYDFYVPTVLINGKGNKYDIAYAEGLVNYSNPKVLEAQNLLNGRFNAYYTSDGRSDSFRFPVSDLSSDTIICRIYYATGIYAEWTISGQSIVNTQSFMGLDVMLTVDHELGVFYFTHSGAPYAIPIMDTYNENNIRITASKKFEKGFEQVVDSTCSVSADGRIYLSGGQNGNVLMSAKAENPLYFPYAATVDIGGADPVIALAMQGKKVIAFKESETYAVTTNKGKRVNEIGLVADNDTLFKSSDTLVSELISKSVGCKFKNTVCSVRGKTVWLGQDYEVYSLQSVGTDSLDCISENLRLRDDYEYMDSFAVSDGRYYILCDNNKAFACDLENFTYPKWYEWQFSHGFILCGGFYKKGRLLFWCNADNSGIWYIAPLNGEYDSEAFYSEDGDIQVYNHKIESFLKTKKYTLSGQNHKNVIESINLALSGKGRVEIGINGRNAVSVDLRFSAEDYDKGEYKSVVLRPHLYDTRQIELYISSDSEFSLGDIEIFYRKTG